MTKFAAVHKSASGTRLPFPAPQKLWQLLSGQADMVPPHEQGGDPPELVLVVVSPCCSDY
jgi:hypothetical protein